MATPVPFSPFSVADLRRKAASRADMVNNPFVQSDEMLEFLNSGWDTLWQILSDAYEDFQTSSYVVTLLSNVGEYDLSLLNPPIYKFRGADVLIGQLLVPLEPFMFAERGSYPPGPNSFAGIPMTVRYTPQNQPLSDGTTIAVASNGAALPQATINVASTAGFNAAGTLSVSSTAGFQTVAYTGITPTTFTGCTGGAGNLATGGLVTIPGTIAALPGYIQNNWAELIVLEAAILCATKEEGIAGNLPPLMAMRDKKEAQIKGAAPSRDSGAPRRSVRRADKLRGFNEHGPIPRLRPFAQATSLRYRFHDQSVSVLGGVWP